MRDARTRSVRILIKSYYVARYVFITFYTYQLQQELQVIFISTSITLTNSRREIIYACVRKCVHVCVEEHHNNDNLISACDYSNDVSTEIHWALIRRICPLGRAGGLMSAGLIYQPHTPYTQNLVY